MNPDFSNPKLQNLEDTGPKYIEGQVLETSLATNLDTTKSNLSTSASTEKGAKLVFHNETVLFRILIILHLI